VGYIPIVRYISRIAKRKLNILHYAFGLKDLKVMHGNRPELLKGNNQITEI